MLDLVLEADVAQRPLVAPNQFHGIEVAKGLPQVVRVRLVEGLWYRENRRHGNKVCRVETEKEI